MPPPVKPRNDGGPFEFVVDAESDLASVNNPAIGQFALALAEGSLHFHTGTIWQEIVGGGGAALNTVQNTAWYTRYVGVGTNLTLKYSYTYSSPNGTFTEKTLIDQGYYWVFAWAGGNGGLRAYDPQGWINATPYTSSYWATDVPANVSFTLPKGWYLWGWAYRSLGDPVPDTVMEPYLDYGDYPTGAGILGEYQVYNNTNPEVNDLAPFPRIGLRSGLLIVHTADTVIVPSMLLSENAWNNAGIDYLDFYITRVAQGA